MKKKLTIDEQIEDLKKKGVTFEIMSEEEAKKFLRYNNYYFKLKSYAKNYPINPKNGKYVNLEFAYLQELSTLDMHFRRFCLRLTLDLEHILKTKLIRDFNLNDSCDGYQIILDYLTTNESLSNELSSFKSFGYTAKDVILAKYSGNLAIWNFIEIIEFGKTYKDNKSNELDKQSGIWISTSIVEASLDIDFDYLFTELLDLNSLFQRFGRCNRKGAKNVTMYNCYVYTQLDEGDFILGNKGFIDKTIFELSNKAIHDINGKLSESKKQELINRYLTTENISQSHLAGQ